MANTLAAHVGDDFENRFERHRRAGENKSQCVRRLLEAGMEQKEAQRTTFRDALLNAVTVFGALSIGLFSVSVLATALPFLAYGFQTLQLAVLFFLCMFLAMLPLAAYDRINQATRPYWNRVVLWFEDVLEQD